MVSRRLQNEINGIDREEVPRKNNERSRLISTNLLQKLKDGKTIF